MYPWGNDFDSKKANTDELNLGDTSDVGKFSPQGDSIYGCADMAGNVWEWCHDWFSEETYKKRSEKIRDPQGAKSGSYRVLRGGSFNYNKYYARCSYRLSNLPANLNRYFGFRIVLSSIKIED